MKRPKKKRARAEEPRAVKIAVLPYFTLAELDAMKAATGTTRDATAVAAFCRLHLAKTKEG